MISTKTGVRAFSSAPQNEITKNEQIHSISATDQKKLQGENVGDLLNQISDPNWVDPSKKIRAVGNNKLDKDAFMKLMLAQMKNQDPTNPLKSHEMAAQLAQFTSVEQMMNINQTLSEMQKGQKPTESFQALNFIGKSVSGDSSRLVRGKGDKEHEFNFDLPDDSSKLIIQVRNQEGDIVKKIELKDYKKGSQSWTWDGTNESGATSPMGEYHFNIEAWNKGGKKLSVKTDFEGIISGVNFTNDGPVLLIGTQTVKLKDVQKIIDPSLKNGTQSSRQDQNIKKYQDMRNDQNFELKHMQDLNNSNESVQNESMRDQERGEMRVEQQAQQGQQEQQGQQVQQGQLGASERQADSTQKILNQVGMSRGMMQKLEKEIK